MGNTQYRIKYCKLDDAGNLKKSLNSYSINGGKKVVAFLDLVNKTFSIQDEESGEVLASGGNTKNNMVLMRKVKSTLIDLGANLKTEVRATSKSSKSSVLSNNS